MYAYMYFSPNRYVDDRVWGEYGTGSRPRRGIAEGPEFLHLGVIYRPIICRRLFYMLA